MKMQQLVLLMLLAGVSHDCFAPEPGVGEEFGWNHEQPEENNHDTSGDQDGNGRPKKRGFLAKLFGSKGDDSAVEKPKKQLKKSETDTSVSIKPRVISAIQAQDLVGSDISGSQEYGFGDLESSVEQKPKLSKDKNKEVELRLTTDQVFAKGKFTSNAFEKINTKAKSLFKDVKVVRFMQEHLSDLFPAPKSIQLVYQGDSFARNGEMRESYSSDRKLDSLDIGDQSWSKITVQEKKEFDFADETSETLSLSKGMSKVEEQYSDFLLSKLLAAPLKKLQSMDIRNDKDKQAFTKKFKDLADIQTKLGKSLVAHLKSGKVNADEFINNNSELFDAMQNMMTAKEYREAVKVFVTRLS